MFKYKNILFWGIIVAVIATVFSLYYFSLSGKAKLTPSQQVTTSSPLIPLEELDLSSKTTMDWSVCRNEKYGYEFKYPKGWYVYKYTADGETGYTEEVPTCVDQGTTILSKKPSVRSGFYPPSVRILIEDVDTWKNWLQQNTELNTRMNVPYSITNGELVGNKPTYYTRVGIIDAAIFHDEKAIIFTVTGDTGGKILSNTDLSTNTPERELLDAILSTFRFTSQ